MANKQYFNINIISIILAILIVTMVTEREVEIAVAKT